MALMIDHSASVSSKGGLGIMECNSRTFSTTVEIVKRNIYICRGMFSGCFKISSVVAIWLARFSVRFARTPMGVH